MQPKNVLGVSPSSAHYFYGQIIRGRAKQEKKKEGMMGYEGKRDSIVLNSQA